MSTRKSNAALLGKILCSFCGRGKLKILCYSPVLWKTLQSFRNQPFRDTIQFIVNPASKLSFPLQFRIPAWATGAMIRVNGEVAPAPKPGSFAAIDRIWISGDRVELKLPMPPFISHWYRDSVVVERGPLVFSYAIGESWVKLRDRGMTADWQVFPTAPWNYALTIDTAAPTQSITVTETDVVGAPFTAAHAPTRLKVKARKLDGWRAEDGVADPLPQTPVASDQPEEVITLIPYAAAKLRITAFPHCKS